MSVVERALKKLQNAGSGGSAAREPIARVAVPNMKGAGRDEVQDDESLLPLNRPFIEFDLDALSRAGLYSESNRKLADEYRLIKQPLLKKATATGSPMDEPRTNLIMVASALAGEGKTFTSVNLSLSIAREKDWSVLLVDVDCRNPQLSRLLGVMDQPGLLDLLKDRSLPFESHVMETNVNGLTVLPLGETDGNAAELLASSRMSALCDELATRTHQRIVVFDSSPLLLTTEASILSAQVGQVVMVVQANKTPRHAAQEAIEKLNGDKPIGLILNRADNSGDTLGYGSHYGYGAYSSQ